MNRGEGTDRPPERWLAGAALLLAGLAPLAGAPATAPGRPAGTSEAGPAGRISAVEVARALRARDPSLRLIDLRSEAAYEAFHLPRAERRDPARLDELPVDVERRIVVYAATADAAARARRTLAAAGHPSPRYLADGVGEWTRDVMNPVLPADAGPEARERFRELAELSRYFGGLPRILRPGEADPRGAETDELLSRTLRRGCAF